MSYRPSQQEPSRSLGHFVPPAPSPPLAFYLLSLFPFVSPDLENYLAQLEPNVESLQPRQQGLGTDGSDCSGDRRAAGTQTHPAANIPHLGTHFYTCPHGYTYFFDERGQCWVCFLSSRSCRSSLASKVTTFRSLRIQCRAPHWGCLYHDWWHSANHTDCTGV